MNTKQFQLMDNAEFQRLSRSEKIVYLTKAIAAVRKEAGVADAAEPKTDWADTIPVGTRKPR